MPLKFFTYALLLASIACWGKQSEEAIAKFFTPEKSKILSQFGGVALQTEPCHKGHTLRERTCGHGAEMAQTGDFAGMKNFAIASEIESHLKTLAETKEFGYKAANLFELQNIVEMANLACEIEITLPDFYPISSSQIQSYLLEHGLYLAQEWENLLDSLSIEERFLLQEGKQIGSAFSLGLEKMREKIQHLFDQPVSSSSLFSKELLILMEKTSSFIIRSTGREDQIGFANAGGNQSIKNVPPSMQQILHAIGEVITSYFSEKSIGQRLLFKDLTLFERPFTPVLIQKMVQAKDRPIEIVVHTTEQSGPTPGLVSFNCGYDVVESKERADLYYYFHAKTGHAILAKNVVHLPENCRFAIATLAKMIQDYYSHPTDVELLITREDDAFTIHLVQARPLCRPNYRSSPDFIINLEELPKETIFRVETVVAAGSFTRDIHNRNQLILAQSLNDALEQFLFHTPEKERINAILVQGEAEPNSHEATTFAGCGKVVQKVADFDLLQTFLESGSFIIDPQQGVIVKEKEKEKIKIKQGFVTHPMPCLVSIETASPTKFPFAIESHFPKATLSSLLEILKKGEKEQPKRALSSLLFHLQEKISCLQTEPESPCIQDALNQLESLKDFAEKKAVDVLEFLNYPPSDLRRLAAIKPLEALFFQEEDLDLEKLFSLSSVLKKLERRKNFLSELHVKPHPNFQILDALCEAHDSAITISLKHKWIDFVRGLTEKELIQIAEMIHTLQNLNALSVWIQTTFSNQNPSLSALFTEYHEALALSKELKEMQEALSLISIGDWEKPEKFEVLFECLPIPFLKSEEWKKIFLQKGRLSQILALSFMTRFIDLFDDQYIKTFLASTKIPQKQKVMYFKKIVKAYFSLLKAWEPLSTLTQEMKNWAFADFLDDIRTDVPYLFHGFDRKDLSPSGILKAAKDFPEDVFEELPDTTKNLIQEKFPYASLKEGSLLLATQRFATIETFQNYIEKMEHGIESTNPLNEWELFPPPLFHVDSELYINAIKTQKIGFFEGYTLAAFFTLIHQNINTIFSNLAIQCGLDQFDRPPLLKSIESKIQNLGFLMDETGEIKRPSLIGTRCNKTSLSLIYNLPLKLHGVTYDLQYNPLLNEVFVKINFVSVDNDLPSLAKLFSLGVSFLKAKQVHTTTFEKDMQAFFSFDSSFQIDPLDLFLQSMHELTSSKLKDPSQKRSLVYTEQFVTLLEKESAIQKQFQTILRQL